MGPVHWAAKQGEMAEVQRLLRTDSTLMESRGSGGMTPLLWAVAGCVLCVCSRVCMGGRV
eukprot:31702-Eustigmatos_ZCMA.PRE.1